MTTATRDRLLAGALAAATVLVYLPSLQHGFVNYDDNEYVLDNPPVRAGLTASGVVWAFTAAHSANWHPLTWLSHMVDVELWGLAPSGHHLTSVLLHAAAATLLFDVLRRMTGDAWRSLLVATVFALHPLRVESVAWVAERKDVLAAFWWMVGLWAYWWYVTRPSAGRYALVALAFVAGLLAKPMVVTFPAALLLLDVWPLRRPWSARLVVEKLPLLALSVAASVVTFVVQRDAGAMATLEGLPLGERIANAIVAYATYLRLTVWPSGLAVFYPRRPLSPVTVGGAAALLVAVTALASWQARVRPWLAVGWLWFVGTLVPVIGIVKVGDQALADRFTYLPQIGLLLMAAWSLSAAWVMPVTAVATVACALLTMRQQAIWRDSVTLFTHTAAVAPDNYIAETNLGAALLERGRADEALPHLRRGQALAPAYAKVHVSLGAALAATGDGAGALAAYAEAARLAPDSASPPFNAGLVLAAQGRLDEAVARYREAIARDPQHVNARIGLGMVLAAQGRLDDAVREYEAALAVAPDDAAAHGSLALALDALGRHEQAIAQHRTAVALAPAQPFARYNLAASYAAAGRTDEAIATLREALVLQPNWPEARADLAALEAQSHGASP
ncbi:MAG TPA: tetratricopeptide repeat protein [Candidatus Binatia bacterium]|nr:tetratricopeptide repeat protein [Candidatus Binatia bacterium]